MPRGARARATAQRPSCFRASDDVRARGRVSELWPVCVGAALPLNPHTRELFTPDEDVRDVGSGGRSPTDLARRRGRPIATLYFVRRQGPRPRPNTPSLDRVIPPSD